MVTLSSHYKAKAAVANYFFILVILVVSVHAGEDSSKPDKPKTDDRRLYIVAGTAVVLPEGVEEAPQDYRGAIGVRPFALIKIKGKIIGEVYASPLKGASTEEAKDMAASADKGKGVELLEKTTIRDAGKLVEVVKLKFDLNRKIGKPWILHSLYFAHGKSSTTFKLTASESNFESALPYFQSMLSIKTDADTPNE